MGKVQFGETVRQARVKAGLSLREVAARAGIDFTRLSRIEHGSRPAPGLAQIRALAEILSLDMVDLLVAAGTSREVTEHLLWSERLHLALAHPRVQPYRPEGSLLLSKNSFRVRVLKREGALCRVALGEERLTVLSFSTEETLSIEIPPEAVSVYRRDPRSLSASVENVFPAQVKKVRRLGQVTNLVLSGNGFELNTLHTVKQIEAMRLEEGEEVFAAVQATAVLTLPVERTL